MKWDDVSDREKPPPSFAASAISMNPALHLDRQSTSLENRVDPVFCHADGFIITSICGQARKPRHDSLPGSAPPPRFASR